MTNTMNNNERSAQRAAVAAMKHLLATSGETKAMDEVYEAVNQQVKMTREQFEKLFYEAKDQMASWENETSSELNEEDLDMVVGGNAWDWICDHKKEIAIVAAAVVVGGALGAVSGFALTGLATYLAVTSSVIEGAVCGAVVGAVAGYGIATKGLPSASDLLNSTARPL